MFTGRALDSYCGLSGCVRRFGAQEGAGDAHPSIVSGIFQEKQRQATNIRAAGSTISGGEETSLMWTKAAVALVVGLALLAI